MRLYQFFVISYTIAILAGGCGGKNRSTNSAGLKAPRDTMTQFLFAGKVRKQTEVYIYNITTAKYIPLKSSFPGKVVDVHTNSSRTLATIITVSKSGKNGVFPYFQKARLYLLDGKTFATIKTISLGDGIQFVSGFDSDSTFSVTINKIESNMVSHVARQRIIFSRKGDPVNESIKIYDFVKEGYPPLPKQRLQLLSENEKFSITPNDKNAIFLHGGIENPKLLAGESNEKLNAISWTADGTVVVFSTIDVSRNNTTLQTAQPQTSTLYVFSLAENTLLLKIDGAGFKHFDIINDLVIYDNGFGNESRVHIYDLHKKIETRLISFPAGCGLTNISELPQYEF